MRRAHIGHGIRTPPHNGATGTTAIHRAERIGVNGIRLHLHGLHLHGSFRKHGPKHHIRKARKAQRQHGERHEKDAYDQRIDIEALGDSGTHAPYQRIARPVQLACSAHRSS